MQLPPSPQNAALAGAVNSRIKSDAAMVAAQAVLWRLVGVGACAALVGVGVGAALFGYSYITDATRNADRVATAFVEALEKTTIKTTGEVKIEPGAKVTLDTTGSTVALDPNANVKLDAGNTMVKLDPYATVGLRGEIPRPTEAQLGQETKPMSKAPVGTAYTVFKNVTFGEGEVVSGWNFEIDNPTPKSQYCYYKHGVEGLTEITTMIAQNRKLLAQPKAPPGNLNPRLAAESCVWFGGGGLVDAPPAGRTY